MAETLVTMSRDELKALVREAVQEAMQELWDEDMSLEPKFAPEVAEVLRRYKREHPRGISLDDAVKELGIDA